MRRSSSSSSYLSTDLVRETQNAIGFAVTRPDLITHEPDRDSPQVGFLGENEILEAHADLSDALVSKHNTLMPQIKMEKQVVTILK